MGFLDNVVKGLGDDAAGGLSDLLKGQGGVGGLAEKFGQAGLGDVIGSWVGTGPNANISPEQITAVLGHGPIADIAAGGQVVLFVDRQTLPAVRSDQQPGGAPTGRRAVGIVG